MMIEALQAEIEEIAGAIADLQGQLKSLENPLPVAVGADLAEATAAHYESAEPRKRAVQQALETLRGRLKEKQGQLYQARQSEHKAALEAQLEAKSAEGSALAEKINFLTEELTQSLQQSQEVNGECRSLWLQLGRLPHLLPEIPKSTRDPLTGRETAPIILPQATARESGVFIDQKPFSFG